MSKNQPRRPVKACRARNHHPAGLGAHAKLFPEELHGESPVKYGDQRGVPWLTSAPLRAACNF